MSPRQIANAAIIALLRPYTRAELPAWGRLFNLFVGSHGRDRQWRGVRPRWMRGKLHGYEMLLDISGWSNRRTFFLGRFYDLPTQSVLRAILRPGDSFVDIGANEGQMTLLAAHLVGPDGRVDAFEPNPGPRGRLEAAIARNGIATIHLHPIGLGTADGELPLSVPKVNSGEGSFGRTSYAPDQVDVVMCPVRRADDVLGDVRPRLIKIDVEGFELQVLGGMTGLLARHRPAVVMEMVAAHLANAGTSVAELSAFMEARGYAAYRIALAPTRGRARLSVAPANAATITASDVLWLQPDDAARAALALG